MPKGVLHLQEELCKGCGLCVDACPRHLLRLASGRLNRKGHAPVEMADPEHCVACACCAMMCPECVITVERVEGT